MGKKIELTNGMHAVVDTEDYERLNRHSWRYMSSPTGHTGYACRISPKVNGKRSTILMHREVLSCVGHVDHRDLDGLNNQRGNLREATRAQNGANVPKRRVGTSSKFKGVYLHRKVGKWVAKFDRQYLGIFWLETDAACAYDAHVIANCGEFARPNNWRGML